MMKNVDAMPKLPSGWEWAKIGEIAKINYRDPSIRSLPDDTLVTFLPMAGVDAEKGIIAKPEVRSLARVRKGFTQFSEGDVLFAKITPSMENGKAAVAYDLVNGIGFGSTEFHVIKPKKGIQSEWLFHFIRQERFRREGKENFAGTAGQLRVPSNFIKEYFIPIASLQEQYRIVACIEELFSHLDAGVEVLQKAKAQLQRYRQAVLKAAVEGKLTEEWRKAHPEVEPAEMLLKRIGAKRLNNKRRSKSIQDYDLSNLPELPDTWIWVSIDQVSDLITDGDHNPPKRTANGIPHLTAKNIKNWAITEEGCTYITEADFELVRKRYNPLANDVIVTCVGTVGRTAIVPENYIFSADRNLAAVRLVPNTMEPRFLQYNLNTLASQRAIINASGSTAQPHFYLGDIRAFKVALAPIKEQKEIINDIEHLFSIINELDVQFEINLKRSDRLRQSILKRAFGGKLVPQDPNDEPASILLKKNHEGHLRKKKESTPLKRANRKGIIVPNEILSIYEVLSKAGTQLTPEELFKKANFSEETVDEFYQELREEVERSRIIEIRPNEADVYLQVVKNEDK